MRELKFRIGGKSSGGFRYLDKGELINLYSLIPWDGSLVAKDHGRNVIVPKEAYIIEQYTGLKDKNGKEIYEGDIVREVIDSGLEEIDGEYEYIVQWSDEFKEFVIQTTKKNKTFFHDELYQLNMSREVIGNIHENPELLKEEE